MASFVVRWLQYLHDGVITGVWLRFHNYWARVHPYWKVLKATLLHSTVAFVITSFCLYVSAFLFGALYYYSMPTTYQIYPLSFQYKRSCIQEHRNFIRSGQGHAEYVYTKDCFPSAIINLDDSPNKVIAPHQNYAVHLTLQLPESPRNLNIGMFMTTMKYGRKVASQPASMKHRPFMIRMISTVLFWPLLLFGMMESSQTIYISLSEMINFNYGSQEECTKKSDVNYSPEDDMNVKTDNSFSRNCDQRNVVFQIDYPDIEITAATLHMTASFSRLQYLLFQWPIVSFLLGTMMFFTPVLASALVLLYLILYVKSRGSSHSNNISEAEGANSENTNATESVNRDEGPTAQRHHEDCENDCHDDELFVLSSDVDVIGSAEYGKDFEDTAKDDDAAPED